jgi:hypothetical protein
MTPEERMLRGVALFEEECELARAEIRAANPEISEDQTRQILGARLAEERRRENNERAGGNG